MIWVIVSSWSYFCWLCTKLLHLQLQIINLISVLTDWWCPWVESSLGLLEKGFLWPAAAAAKLLQMCLTPCDPIDSSPSGSPVPGILQARTLEWVAISFSSAWKWKVKVKTLSCVRLLATPWTVAHRAPPSMGFSRQEYWSRVSWPSLSMTNMFSWKNSVSLCPASFCSPSPNLPVVADISWLPTFAFQSPMMKRTSLLVLVLKGLIGLCGTGQLQLLQHQWLGHRLWWLSCWIVCLGNEIILSFLRLPPSTAFRTLVDYEGYSISSKGFSPK